MGGYCHRSEGKTGMSDGVASNHSPGWRDDLPKPIRQTDWPRTVQEGKTIAGRRILDARKRPSAEDCTTTGGGDPEGSPASRPLPGRTLEPFSIRRRKQKERFRLGISTVHSDPACQKALTKLHRWHQKIAAARQRAVERFRGSAPKALKAAKALTAEVFRIGVWKWIGARCRTTQVFATPAQLRSWCFLMQEIIEVVKATPRLGKLVRRSTTEQEACHDLPLSVGELWRLLKPLMAPDARAGEKTVAWQAELCQLRVRKPDGSRYALTDDDLTGMLLAVRRFMRAVGGRYRPEMPESVASFQAAQNALDHAIRWCDEQEEESESHYADLRSGPSDGNAEVLPLSAAAGRQQNDGQSGAGMDTPAVQASTASPLGEPPADEKAIEWSKPDGPTQWAKVFGLSYNTMVKRLREGVIRNKKLSDRSYQIAIDDLPADFKRRCR
jgi:hypothetical protein